MTLVEMYTEINSIIVALQSGTATPVSAQMKLRNLAKKATITGLSFAVPALSELEKQAPAPKYEESEEAEPYYEESYESSVC